MQERHEREGDNYESCREHTDANKEVIETEHWSTVNLYTFLSFLMEVMIPSDAKGHKHFRTPWICVLGGDQFLSNEAKRRQESPS